MKIQQAWEMFKKTGKIDYYLEYKRKKQVNMISKVEGFIISEVPYGDTSKIINVLTKEHGLIGIIANFGTINDNTIEVSFVRQFMVKKIIIPIFILSGVIVIFASKKRNEKDTF